MVEPNSVPTSQQYWPALRPSGRLYEANCAECHGENLEGAENDEGIEGPALVEKELSHPDSDFVDIITNGEGGEDEMPGFGDELSSEEILAIVDFVRDVQRVNLDE